MDNGGDQGDRSSLPVCWGGGHVREGGVTVHRGPGFCVNWAVNWDVNWAVNWAVTCRINQRGGRWLCGY